MSVLFRSLEVEYTRKHIYDAIFRLLNQGLLVYNKAEADPFVRLTEDGQSMLSRIQPTKDGVWKLVIFDIPEKKRKIRNHLRSKLKALGFKKWQESIWVSPYALDPAIEEEFALLAEKFFIRLIKTKNINYTKDLEALF